MKTKSQKSKSGFPKKRNKRNSKMQTNSALASFVSPASRQKQPTSSIFERRAVGGKSDPQQHVTKRKNTKASLATLEKEEKRILIFDLKNALAHELGHYFATTSFGGDAKIRVWLADDGDRLAKTSVIGNCQFDYADAFERSVIGWSGEIGKVLLDDDLSEEDIWVTMMDMLNCCEDDLSSSDLAAIKAYEDPEHSLEVAVKVLKEKTGVLRDLVKKLERKFLSSGCEELFYPPEP